MILLDELTTGSWVSYYEGMKPIYEKVVNLTMQGAGVGLPIKYESDNILYQRIVPFVSLYPIPMDYYLSLHKCLLKKKEDDSRLLWTLDYQGEVVFGVEKKENTFTLIKMGEPLGEPFYAVHEFQRMCFTHLQLDFPIELYNE